MNKRYAFLLLLPLVACAASSEENPPAQAATEDELSLQNLYRLLRGTVDRTKPDAANPWTQNVELGLGEENRLPGEAEEFAGYADLINRFQEQARTQDGDATVARGFHKKLHACVRGNLRIDNSKIPQEARVGLFDDAHSHGYVVYSRWSNGMSNRSPDNKADGRGLALKILGVDGERIELGSDPAADTQDFLMFNQSVAPASDVRHLMLFADAVTNAPDSSGMLGKIGNLVQAGRLLTRDENVRIVDFLANRVVPKTKERGSMLADEFFTGIPSALGIEEGDLDTARAKGAMKIRATTGVLQGTRCEPKPTPPGSSDDYLREDLLRVYDAQTPICVQLSLQLQKNAISESIEDGSVDWNTPWIPWGTAIFQRSLGDQANEEAQARCNQFAFTPWHTLAQHRPLGNMMRARRVVLAASQKLRGADTTEPTD